MREQEQEFASSRRRFLGNSTRAALAVTGAGAAAVTLEFLHPKALREEPTAFRIGKPENFAVNSVTSDPQRRIFVVRTEEGFFALSAICTHLGCVVRYVNDEQVFACPCHGSRFREDGSLVQGPARRGLRRLSMRLEEGELIVDSSAEADKEAVLRV